MIELSDPERALAVAHAPASVRPALTILFALDERMGSIVAHASEPMIGMMRLTWWRDALERLDQHEAPAEPLLSAVAAELLPRGVSGADLSAMEQGWTALLDGEADEAALARHGAGRGGVLFGLAGRVLGAEDARLDAAGQGWALADLGHRHSSVDVRARARALAVTRLDTLPGGAWPRRLRPLAMLAALARADATSTGARQQGAPKRLLRMLALRLTGR